MPPGGIEPPSAARKAAALPLDERGMVGEDGLEPSTSRSRTARSARLSYTPWKPCGGGESNSRLLDGTQVFFR